MPLPLSMPLPCPCPCPLPASALTLPAALGLLQDGRNWARIEADHHTGALFDVGAAGDWDELFIAGPQVCEGAGEAGGGVSM